jgi:methanethiol S-methyltransferase
MIGVGGLVAATWHRWDLVALSVVFHCVVLGLFLITAAIPRKRAANLPNGALAAFFVALYAEMYGLPLTLLLLQPVMPVWLAANLYAPPLPVRFLGSAVIVVGFGLVYLGWRAIHANRGGVVRTGVYAYLRHPQYLGLMILTLGQIIQWPTLSAAILWPLLVLLYARLARREDFELAQSYGASAATFQRDVPGFVPRLRRSARATTKHHVRKESMSS